MVSARLWDLMLREFRKPPQIWSTPRRKRQIRKDMAAERGLYSTIGIIRNGYYPI
jgi:hypothetical protein